MSKLYSFVVASGVNGHLPLTGNIAKTSVPVTPKYCMIYSQLLTTEAPCIKGITPRTSNVATAGISAMMHTLLLLVLVMARKRY